jgi:sigma-B regulation protein RsbU (phosphoserine phosphatase)
LPLSCVSAAFDALALVSSGCGNSHVNAGHNPPAVLRRDRSIDWLEPTGAPVGFFSNAALEERTVPLNPGELVIAYTDGVSEAGPFGEEWGMRGLLEAAHACRMQSADNQSSIDFAVHG